MSDTFLTEMTISALTMIIATIVAHIIIQSGLIDRASRKTSKLIVNMTKILIRFGINLAFIGLCIFFLISFGMRDAEIQRIEVLFAIYFAIVGASLTKFLVKDIADVTSSRKPL